MKTPKNLLHQKPRQPLKVVKRAASLNPRRRSPCKVDPDERDLQYEVLLEAQADLEASRENYAELYDSAPVGYLTLTNSGSIQQLNLTAATLLGRSRQQALGRPLILFIAASDRRKLFRHLRQCRRSRARVSTELALNPDDAAQIVAELVSVPAGPDETPPELFKSVLIDITARRRAEVALRQAQTELEDRVRQRTAELTRANTMLEAEVKQHQGTEQSLRDHKRVMEDFFEQSPIGLLWVEPDGRIQKVNAAQLELMGKTLPQCVGQCISEFLTHSREGFEALRRLAAHETLRNFRIRFRGPQRSIRHVLIDANGLWEEGHLTHSRWFVRDISRRVELEREILAIAEREQQRLGRDLHDDLCQQLAGIEFLSETLAGWVEDVSQTGAQRAREIARMVRQAMDRTRDLARGLSPVELEAHGLPMALTELSARARKMFGIVSSFHSDPVLIHDQAVGIHLYRIAQEAIANAIKHGKATRIDIALSGRDDQVILCVRDNGSGLPRRLDKRRGMGLRVMQYRADVIGGSLSVERRDQGGTSVSCAVRTNPPVSSSSGSARAPA